MIKQLHHNKKYSLLITAIFLLSFFAMGAEASTTLGTIDPNNAGNYKAKLFNDSGFGNLNMNFGKFTTQSAYDITITDAGLRGFAWGQLTGWIVTNCADTASGCTTANGNFKVSVDSTGLLSGYAWGDDTGWINFGPFANSSTSRVKIGSTGLFGGSLGSAGYAWSQNFGWILFDCTYTDSCVETDYRPSSTRGGGGGGSSGGSGGHPTDVCLNIPGNQFTVPVGKVLVGQGQCVDPEICPNITSYDSVPLSSAGPFVVNVGNTKKIGFAIKTFDKINPPHPVGDIATENILNAGSHDQVVTVNPSSNKYLLGFEDVVNGDYDFNDLVVDVSFSCSPDKNAKCSIPMTLSDSTPDIINNAPKGELNLQTILNNAGYNVNVYTDQKQYQAWNTPTPSIVTITTKFINKFAGNSFVFGYYTDGSMGNFVPIFRTANIPYAQSAPGMCTPNPNDICQNIDGIQTVLPPGKVLNVLGQCVDVVQDVCQNLDGNQLTVPDGYMYDKTDSICIPIVVTPPFCTAHPTDPSCIPGSSFCVAHPTAPSCVNTSPTFCADHPTDPSCVPGSSFCVAHPTAPSCVNTTPTFCSTHPTDPSCVNTPPTFCSTHPTDPSCVNTPPTFCSTHPTDPNCTVQPVLCTTNPTDPSCVNPPPTFCSTHPTDPSCAGAMGGFCSEHPTDPSCLNSTSFCLANPNSLSCIITQPAFCATNPNSPICVIDLPLNKKPLNLLLPTGAFLGLFYALTNSLFENPIAFSEVSFVPIRLWNLLTALLGIRRKRPWGVIYDSVTKQPLDPVYVILEDSEGNEISTSITDLDGRYGFLVPKTGQYKIIAHKTNYEFPSKKLSGRTGDDIYQDLYFGEVIDIRDGEVIIKNIPMDRINFDWNEFAKKKQHLMKLFSRWDVWFARLSNLLFWFGFTFASLVAVLTPSKYNNIIFAIYVLLFFLKRTLLRPRSFGDVKFKATGQPLSFAVIKVMIAGTEHEFIRKVANNVGRYYCLVPNGHYEIKIENKNPDGSYSLVYNSDIEVKNNHINKKFRV